MIKVFSFDYGSFDSKLRLIQLLGVLNIIGFLRIAAFDVSKAFNNVWYPGIIYELTTCGILVNYSELFLHFSVKNYVTLSEKYSQDCVVNAGITLFLDQHFSFYKMTIFLMIMISRALQMFLWYHTDFLLLQNLIGGSYIVSVAKTVSKKIEALFCEVFFPEVMLEMLKASIWSSVKLCCHV